MKHEKLFGPVLLDLNESLEGYADHLMHLDDEGLRLRFGMPKQREDAAQWAMGLKDTVKAKHVLWGTKNGWGDLVGICHLVIQDGQAEIALSTSIGYRRRGISKSLMHVAISYLQNRGIEHIYMVCLSENTAVQQLAKKCGIVVVTMHGESEAKLKLPWPTPASITTETIANTLTMMDRQMSLNLAIWDRLLTTPAKKSILSTGEKK